MDPRNGVTGLRSDPTYRAHTFRMTLVSKDKLPQIITITIIISIVVSSSSIILSIIMLIIISIIIIVSNIMSVIISISIISCIISFIITVPGLVKTKTKKGGSGKS